MADFFQELLEWVDQPPPPRGRDTHAIAFALHGTTPDPNLPYYKHGGFMFFRPRGTGHGPVGSLPGLTGVGFLLNEGTAPQNTPHWVKVDVLFRLPEVFASLNFLGGADVPQTSRRTVEVDAQIFGDHIYLEAPPEWWRLANLQKTTVLYGFQ